MTRFYDLIVARWTSIDPMAEEYDEWSPYNYTLNNPTTNIDPNGMWTANASGLLFGSGEDELSYKKEQIGIAEARGDGPDKPIVLNEVLITANTFTWPAWFLYLPVLGPAASSGNNLARGNYVAAAGDFGTSLAELITLGYSAGLRFKVPSFGSVAKTGLTFNKGVLENFTKHAFAGGRHADLGLSVEKMASKGLNLVERNSHLLKAGDNTLTGNINEIQKSLKHLCKMEK